MSRLDLRGRLVIVTGASSGLGRAIALRLAEEEGADVILAARRADRLQDLADQIAATGRRAFPVPADLADPRGPAALVDHSWQIAADLTDGGMDRRDSVGDGNRAVNRPFGLVNNAGVTAFGPLLELREDELDRIISLNVRGTLELTRLFLQRALGVDDAASARALRPDEPAVAPRRPRAAVLTIASIAAFTPVPYQAVYAATKHALLGFGESAAPELGREVAMTTFCPGGIATDLVEETGISDATGRTFLAPPERVAGWALRAWKRGRLTATASIENRILRALGRVLPHRLVGRSAERFFRPNR